MSKPLESRLETVRSAVALASQDLEGRDYRDFLEALLAEAEGWKMELEETGEET